MSDFSQAPGAPLDSAHLAAQERERRQRVLKKGTISYSGGAITVDCTVRDLSSGGAKLQVSTPVPIPDHFLLDIPMDGIRAECIVRWRREDQLGVSFVGQVQLADNKVRQRVDPTGLGTQRRSVLRKLDY